MATTEQVIEQIEKYSGNLTMAAKALNIDRTTIYKMMARKPTIKAALDNAREMMIDNVESRLYKSALDGEAWAVCFFLKTQAKHRGYVERTQQEISGRDGSPIAFLPVVTNDVETA